MTQTQLVAVGEDHDERWRLWRAAYAKSSREGTRRAGLFMMVVFAAIAALLAYQLSAWWWA